MAHAQEQAAALADEFATHLDDLLDEGYLREIGPDQQEKVATLQDAEGEEVGALLEVTSTGEANSFYVTLLDGNRFKVTVKHVPDVVPPNSFAATTLGVPTPAEREAFENRPDFPGWDAL